MNCDLSAHTSGSQLRIRLDPKPYKISGRAHRLLRKASSARATLGRVGDPRSHLANGRFLSPRRVVVFLSDVIMLRLRPYGQRFRPSRAGSLVGPVWGICHWQPGISGMGFPTPMWEGGSAVDGSLLAGMGIFCIGRRIFVDVLRWGIRRLFFRGRGAREVSPPFCYSTSPIDCVGAQHLPARAPCVLEKVSFLDPVECRGWGGALSSFDRRAGPRMNAPQICFGIGRPIRNVSTRRSLATLIAL